MGNTNIFYSFSIRWSGDKEFYVTALFKTLRKAVLYANDAPCEVRIRKIHCTCAHDLITQKLISKEYAYPEDQAVAVWRHREH